jgi:hypothetical protein
MFVSTSAARLAGRVALVALFLHRRHVGWRPRTSQSAFGAGGFGSHASRALFPSWLRLGMFG